MTEDDARAWVAANYGPQSIAAMEKLIGLVAGEAQRQNLVAPSTFATMWARHIVDSAQLLDLIEPDLADPAGPTGPWIDIGSGAGFPGLVVAALSQYEVWLIEPRRRRADFLLAAATQLGLSDRVRVVCDRIQAVSGVCASVISARAVAPLSDLFAWSEACATPKTRWIIPKGKTAREDVATARKTWHGVFHVEHSITDPISLIVLASGVARR